MTWLGMMTLRSTGAARWLSFFFVVKKGEEEKKSLCLLSFFLFRYNEYRIFPSYLFFSRISPVVCFYFVYFSFLFLFLFSVYFFIFFYSFVFFIPYNPFLYSFYLFSFSICVCKCNACMYMYPHARVVYVCAYVYYRIYSDVSAYPCVHMHDRLHRAHIPACTCLAHRPRVSDPIPFRT